MAQGPNVKTAKTGNADIKAKGQTTDGRFGSDPQFKGNVKPARDLKVK